MKIAFLVSLLCCGFLLTACNPDYFDEEYAELLEALGEKYDTDDRVPSVAMGFDNQLNSGLPEEIWLALELSFTEYCTETVADPCDILANELARIVINRYTRVNELAGFRIIITNHAVYGSVDARTPNANLGNIFGSTFDRSADHLVKSLTIEEWREELSTLQE